MATLQFSVATRNNILEAIELSLNGQTLSAGAGAGGSVSGTAAPPKMQIYGGASLPANTATAAAGTKLAEFTLPADFMAAAASGQKTLSGSWAFTGLPAAGAGTAATYYRIVDNAGTTCHEQGDITVTGGGGALTLDNVSISSSQGGSITSKTQTGPNA